MITRTRSIKFLNPTPRKIQAIVELVATISIRHNGNNVGTQPSINFVDSDSVVFTATNDNGEQTVNVSAEAVGGEGAGITLDGLNIGGVKSPINTGEVLNIPEDWQYNLFGALVVDGTVINDGIINFD